MSKSLLLQSLLNSFDAAKRKQPIDSCFSSIQPAVQPSNDFEEKLRAALDFHEDETTSHVYLFDLESLRQQFGKKWDLMLNKIHEIVHESIEHHLSNADTCNQYGEASYVVVFTQLDEREARLKCSLITKELAHRLVGSESASNEICLKMAMIADGDQLTFNEISDIDFEVKKTKSQTQTLGNRQLIVEPKLRTRDSVNWGEVQFVYRPLLTLRGMIVSTYICLAVKQGDDGVYSSGYDVLLDSSDFFQVKDLDLLSLANVATETVGMAATGAKALLSLPVHFETMADPHSRSIYLDYCHRFLKPHAERLVFELVELPEGVPQFRLIELVGMLRPSARAVIARFPITRKNFGTCRSAGLHAVGTDLYYSHERELVTMKQMNQFVASANKEFLKTYIHGIHTVSLNTAAITAGFDYVDGYALTSVANAPKQACRYDLHAMYSPLLSQK